MNFEQAFFYVDGLYRFGGNVRWNLFWTSPTLAAVFVSSLLPYFWVSRYSAPLTLRFCAQAGVELALWFLLLKTYSRGAFVSTLVAYVAYQIVRSRRGEKLFDTIGLVSTGCRAALVLLLALAVGWVARVEPSYLARDQSILNRLPIWVSALKMVAVAPVGGWGSGQAGISYTQWFQPEESHAVFRGVVSTPLDIAVEYGLPALVFCLALVACGCAFAIKGRGSRFDTVLSRAAASLLATLLTAQFVSIGPIFSLYIMPIISIGVIILAVSRMAARLILGCVVVGLGIAILGGSTLFCAGKFFLQRDEVIFRPLDQNWVSVRRHSKATGTLRLALMPTRGVNGKSYGTLANCILSRNPEITELLIARNEHIAVADLERIHCPNVVAFGEAIIGFPASTAFRRIVYHPSVMPPLNLDAEGMLVYLPDFDETGTFPSWKLWASNHAMDLLRSADMNSLATPDSVATMLFEQRKFWKETP